MKKKVRSVFYDLFDEAEADHLEMISQHVKKKAKSPTEHQKLFKRLKAIKIIPNKKLK